MTAYMILERVSHPQDSPGATEQWEATGTVNAPSAVAAIRGAVSEGGTYVAVPARSWKPVTVEAVQTTVLKLS